jgi:hypothetical protein
VCGNCSTWQAHAADTWGATYRTFTEKDFGKKNISVISVNNTASIIKDIDLLYVSTSRLYPERVGTFNFVDAIIS